MHYLSNNVINANIPAISRQKSFTFNPELPLSLKESFPPLSQYQYHKTLAVSFHINQ